MTRPNVTSTYPPSMAVIVGGAVYPVAPAHVNFDRCDRVVMSDPAGDGGYAVNPPVWIRIIKGAAYAGPLLPPPLGEGQQHLALIVVHRAATSIINRNIYATEEPS